jgi:hypothetical protein
MRKRRKLFVLLFCAVWGGALIVLLNRDNQTTYQGTSLSKWVGIYSQVAYYPGFGRAGPAEKEKAADAIRHIGTNALPLLLALIDDRPPGLWRRGGDLSQRLPDWIRGSAAARWLRQHHRVILVAEDARSVSEPLGPIAAPAIPELIQRLSSTNWTGRRDLAKYALACTGPEAMAKSAAPSIAMLLSDSDLRVRMAATNALLKIAPEILTNAPPR